MRDKNNVLTFLFPPVLPESPFDPLRRQMNSVLLTVDLTKAVADEAIERNDSIVVAYRMSGPGASHPMAWSRTATLPLPEHEYSLTGTREA